MTRIHIEEVQKTDIAGLFTICFEGDDARQAAQPSYQEWQSHHRRDNHFGDR